MNQDAVNAEQDADPPAPEQEDWNPPLTSVEALIDLTVTHVALIASEVRHEATNYLLVRGVDTDGAERRVMLGIAIVRRPAPNDADMWQDLYHGSAFFTPVECLRCRLGKPLFAAQGKHVDLPTLAEKFADTPWADQVVGPTRILEGGDVGGDVGDDAGDDAGDEGEG